MLILSAARDLAESVGWEAVTTRRLSDQIKFSQSVLYRHFKGKEEIVRGVAIEGFGELADALREARLTGAPDDPSLDTLAWCYAKFAATKPALYEAMFMLSTDLAFGGSNAPESLVRCFAELKESVTEVAGGRDPETFTEVIWASLHGLVMLECASRLRPRQENNRLALLVRQHLTEASSPAGP
nr:TetR/AcrR family transcriptional regulator [Frankia sp. QA3]